MGEVSSNFMPTTSENKMNICFFLNSGGWSGAENVVYNLAKFIERKGHNISIILNEETYPYFKDLKNVKLYNIGPVFDYEKFLRANFDVSIPPVFSKYGFVSKVLRFFLGPPLRHLNYIKLRNKVLKIIEKINPDVIHFHNPVVLDFYSHIFKYLKYPSIYTSHGLDFKKRGNPVDKITDLKKRGLLATFDKITTVSKYMKEYLVSNGIRSDINVIENGIDANKLKSIKKIELKYKKTFIIMFPGGDKKIKGGTYVVNAANILKNKNIHFHLYIAGKVPKSSYLKNLVRKFDLNEYVTFLGLLEQDKYLRFLKSADLLVQPDESSWPGLVLFEALALNVPILTYRLDYLHEIFEEGKNCVFTKKEPDDIANKIMMLYEKKNFRKKLVTNNSEKLKKLDWNNITDQYIALYSSILL